MLTFLRRKIILALFCSTFLIHAHRVDAALINLTPLVSLNDVINNVGNQFPGNQLIVGDKIFSNFEMIGSASGGAISPSLLTFQVQGVFDDVLNQYGLMFNPNMGAGSGQTADARLAFKITVDAQHPNNKIDGAILSASGASASGNGHVDIAESIYATSSPVNPIASLDAFKDQFSPPSALQDSATWAPGLPMVWVRKDVFVTGGQIGGAHITEFFQFYHQITIPEPSTMAFSFLSLAFVAGCFRRKK